MVFHYYLAILSELLFTVIPCSVYADLGFNKSKQTNKLLSTPSYKNPQLINVRRETFSVCKRSLLSRVFCRARS